MNNYLLLLEHYNSSASGRPLISSLPPPKITEKCRSRLIVKNLPTYITEPRLREHFTSTAHPGELTDVRIVHKKDGSTRRIAFIGFKTEEQAQSARDYFDKSYLDISKLRVETVTGTKDAPITVRDQKRSREHTDDDGIKQRKRQKLDAPPSSTTTTTTTTNVLVDSAAQKKKGKKSQLEEFQAVMGAKCNGRPSWAAEVDSAVPTGWPKRVEPSQAGAESASEKKDKHKKGKTKVEEESGDDDDGAKEGLSDMEWMRRKMQAASTLGEEKAFEQSDEEAEKTDTPVKGAQVIEDEPVNPTHASILSNGRLFVRNLVFSCTDDELKAHFATFGEIEQVHIPLDSASQQPKGFAYIRFKDPTHAVAAHDALDGSTFQGRLLHILPAVDRNPKPVDDRAAGGDKAARLKDVRAQKKKENSGKDFNWGVLYMNSDAVANSIADRLGISKSDIVNPDSSGVGGSAAVKLALAETHIITETKKYFEQRNVDLSLFSQSRAARSKSIILVKNIPYGTSSTEITELFGAFGRLRRVLLPPAGTIAVVEFAGGQEKEAQNAWRGLAYKRLKDSILYLEWAPHGLFDGPPPTDPEIGNANRKGKMPSATTSNDVPTLGKDNERDGGDEEEEDGEDEEVPPGATLHIGNLSFATTSDRLSSIFQHLPYFAFAKVATKVDPAKPGETLSQGFGFVGFKNVEGAKKALKGVHAGTSTLVLDGHVLRVSFAGRGKEDMEREGRGKGVGGKEGKGKGKGTKLIVKNLAFEVSRKELWELFSAHGQVKSVRLPNRADRRSRGFAFVDFATRKEAEHAMEQLRHSHLLGRHLVMEWAEKEVGNEEMRMKTMMEFGDGGGGNEVGRKEKLKLGLNGKGEGSDEE